ncbi:aquaporin-3-like [Ptychodera flava]|uniref:aquaporin-3-like n=1 Tax=Ptychodera flava TaxID=63121 RepID=UPI00396A7925
MGAYTKFINKITNAIAIKNRLVRESLAEFIGTFILMIFGNGSEAQSILSRGAYGEYLSVNWAWGIAVTMGIHFASSVSGAHINPAVTLAKAVVGRFPWYKVIPYWIMQCLGAFAASACVYGVYYDAINAFDDGIRQVTGPNATAAIFATYPGQYLSIASGLGDQIVGTMLLLSCIFAIIDERNAKPPTGMEPFLIGLAVFVIGLSFGANCGYPLNPARDFPPRLFSYMVGYPDEVWTPNGVHWWWVPIVGPFIGGICGAVVYIILIEAHHPKVNELGGTVTTNDEDVEMKRVGNTDRALVESDQGTSGTENKSFNAE